MIIPRSNFRAQAPFSQECNGAPIKCTHEVRGEAYYGSATTRRRKAPGPRKPWNDEWKLQGDTFPRKELCKGKMGFPGRIVRSPTLQVVEEYWGINSGPSSTNGLQINDNLY